METQLQIPKNILSISPSLLDPTIPITPSETFEINSVETPLPVLSQNSLPETAQTTVPITPCSEKSNTLVIIAPNPILTVPTACTPKPRPVIRKIFSQRNVRREKTPDIKITKPEEKQEQIKNLCYEEFMCSKLDKYLKILKDIKTDINKARPDFNIPGLLQRSKYWSSKQLEVEKKRKHKKSKDKSTLQKNEQRAPSVPISSKFMMYRKPILIRPKPNFIQTYRHITNDRISNKRRDLPKIPYNKDISDFTKSVDEKTEIIFPGDTIRILNLDTNLGNTVSIQRNLVKTRFMKKIRLIGTPYKQL